MRKSNKYNHHLLRKLDTHAEEHPEKAGHAKLHVLVRYTGEIEKLRHAGLFVMGNAGGVAIGEINEGDLEKLEQLDNVIHISTEPPISPQLNTSVPEIHGDVVRNGSPSYTGAGVIIGVLDSGIDIFHKNFRKSDGSSRILSIWDQTIHATGSQQPPVGYTMGVEFTADDIKNALASPNTPFAHQDVRHHGTHVAGIAAGNASQSGNCHESGTFWGVAPDADLVVVKVLTDPTSPTNPKPSLNLAAQYVFDIAQKAKKAAVLNMSLSWGLGPRDGTSLEERYLDGLLTSTAGMAIVVAAGNSGGTGDAGDVARGIYLWGSHASKYIAANDETTVTLNVPAQYRGPSVPGPIEIWYTSGAGRLQVQVTGPTGIIEGPVAVGSATDYKDLTIGSDVVRVRSSINSNNNKGQISLSIAPPPGGFITAGQWIITLTETAGTDVRMDLWTQNVELRMANIVVAFSDRVAASTICSPGTAKNVITVGAYGSQDGKLADFSGVGPTLADDGRIKPDLCAPGLESNPSEGIMAPKAKGTGGCCCDCCYSGFYTDFYGTSQATPHVTGVVALMLQKNPNQKIDDIIDIIQRTCREPPSPWLNFQPDYYWGYGKVDAQAAVGAVTPGGPYTGSPVLIADAPPGDTGEGTPVGSAPIAGQSSATTMPAVTTFDSKPNRARQLPPLSEAFPQPSLRMAKALRDVAVRGKNNPAVQALVGLVSMHFDEVSKLINTNRRIATKWHRMFGPELLRSMLWNRMSGQQEAMPVIPATLNNQDVSERMRSLFDVLIRYGSARLRNDVRSFGPLFFALPGATFSGLTFPPHPETPHGAGWNA
jgi:subtilisin family serine protease